MSKLDPRSGTIIAFAVALGIVATCASVLVWAPQIIKTYQVKGPGALSVVMLCLQLPGNLLTVYFQAILHGNSFTTWTPFLVAALQQMILIVMCFFYKIRQIRRTENVELDEDKALIEESEDEENFGLELESNKSTVK